ncbi:hypothetical protein [Micromonospora sp. NPDC005299]|uniref:hypothetical protein n=1 Tax=Micromonospora sp. NPDC005299 TaxID=3364231 RepID=UPI0036BBA823
MTDARRLPNETVGLPAGFLRAGAGCVIGTLWPVADLPGPLMQRCQLLLGVPERAARCRPRGAAHRPALCEQGFLSGDLFGAPEVVTRPARGQ